ncbi:Hypothetical protein SRAE_0000073200 [Strongyloides ratti]|uniref:Uncharacterized protein n=1 Tax=Strongyloides ratti TaxID=34506 RepID=A0A090KVU0_STRRB|nr:Hypothetical protein SRAE_0000073200 [Strongyloides ratti]CEF61615.1 Hypothetical protein SRAE_0000073200 [Strongyloides ratti]
MSTTIYSNQVKLASNTVPSDYFEDCWINLPSSFRSVLLKTFDKNSIKNSLSEYWNRESYPTGLLHLKQLARFLSDLLKNPQLLHSLTRLVESNQFKDFVAKNNLELTKDCGTNWHYTSKLIKEPEDNYMFDNTLNEESINTFGFSTNSRLIDPFINSPQTFITTDRPSPVETHQKLLI